MKLERQRPCLKGEQGEFAGQVLSIPHEVTFGRSEGCDVTLSDRKLSRRHARVWVDGDRLHIEDLDSQHGTFVNGVQTIRQSLAIGDVVEFGSHRFTVSVANEAVAAVEIVQDPARLQARLVKPVSPETLPNLETRNWAILHEISLTVQRSRDTEAMLGTVIDRLLVAVGADRGYVALLDDSGALIPTAVRYRDPKLASFDRGRVAISRTVAHRVLEERCAMISEDAATDERFATTDTVLLSDVSSLLAVPILVSDRVLGLIELESFVPEHSLSEQELDLLSVVASTIGIAIDNRALQERLVRTEQMAIIGRLASGIAHEVKNHLSPFMLAELIASRYPDDQEIQEASEMMIEAQKHIYGLVDEIRLFARGTKADYDIAPHDLCALVEGLLQFLKCDAKVKQTNVEFLREGEPLVMIDANRIRQVLINLVRNAADAVEGRDGKIVIRVRESDDQALIDVMDNGKGIASEAADRIFEPFYSTKGDKGLGLGLDISRKIVKAHDGALTFNSEVGKGTTFRLALPLPPE